MNWYPETKSELNEELRRFLSSELDNKSKEVHGLIVPHAGYQFSGKIAGKAFSFLKGKGYDNVVILGPSHYVGFQGIRVMKKSETPLGEFNILKNNFESIGYEHSLDNQIPFLQELGFRYFLPLAVGELSEEEAEKFANKLSEMDDTNTTYIFSSDLSHFLPYEKAVKIDKETIKIIEELDIQNYEKMDACGKFALLVMMNLCKIKGWQPKLIEYKNSGDITNDKTSVVGYSSFWF